MKEQKITRGEKNSFFSGKGFYIALALSIIAVGGAAWIGVNSSLDNISERNDEIEIEAPTKPVEQKEWDIPVEEPEKPPIDDKIKANEETNNNEDIDKKEDIPSEKSPVSQGFIMPINGDILNPYSGDNVVKSKTLDEWVMHTGIDIACEKSSSVKAVSGGKVLDIKNDSMWGACVVIEHGNGVESHYYNLKSAINVKVNQEVKMGDVIGSVGATAEIESAEESHLHFAMKQNGNWIDPMSLIKLVN